MKRSLNYIRTMKMKTASIVLGLALCAGITAVAQQPPSGAESVRHRTGGATISTSRPSETQTRRDVQVAMSDEDSGDSEDLQFFSALTGVGNQAPPALVIAPRLETKDVSGMEEDLAVMSRILEKASRGTRDAGAQQRFLGIVVSGAGGRSPQNFYFEGYGAVFLINVPFPLAAPAQGDDSKTEKEDNSTWEQTKRELYSGNRSGGFSRFEWHNDNATVAYDSEAVEDLKKEVLLALKNANHLRAVNDNETVVVALNGVGGREGRGERSVQKRVKRPAGHPEFQYFNGSAAPGKSTLVIQVKKSDVDAFAKNKIEFEEFKKKAVISAR
jgi:hypothetical protein